MTTDERQELIDRLRTFAAAIEDGVTIQQFACGKLIDRKDEWLMGILSELRTVRTKPKPLERWVVIHARGETWLDDESLVPQFLSDQGGRVVHLREVTQ